MGGLLQIQSLNLATTSCTSAIGSLGLLTIRLHILQSEHVFGTTLRSKFFVQNLQNIFKASEL
jgi:hypothetical protein